MSSAGSAVPPVSSSDESSLGAAANYVLKSDLAQYCLPSSNYDPTRKFAWANSICFITLFIGIVGFYVPQMAERKPAEINDVIPVVFTPPTEPPKEVQEASDEPPDQPAETVVEQVQVATVVASDPAQAAFAVPVKGPVTFAPVSRAEAPPANVRRVAAPPPKPVVFTGMGREGYPRPSYPATAQRRGFEGKLTLYVIVDEDGNPKEVRVQDPSGVAMLDDHSVKWVQTQWHWPAGGVRHFIIPFEYKLAK